ncbi:MAG: DUF2339 domain-containing protein [Bacteroidota bacterium]|nr:DUF2339 domain-containing protein [Bacteroidota bacterium]
MDNEEKINELMKKMEALSGEIEKHREEIILMRKEILALRNENYVPDNFVTKKNTPKTTNTTPGVENFIGLTLINFVGIIVLITGLSIGVKYAIDINLISPFMRILLTYIAGAFLFILSARLRKKYQLLGIILFSGAMASAYFTTYAAFEYYNIIPRSVAFLLMLVLTFLTVYFSLKYDKKEIAILGLVGAYGIPFFVKGNSENVSALFGYIFLINSGVLLISFRKYWLALTYISFFTTWIIYLSWLIIYSADNANDVSIMFCYLFFIFFIVSSLVFKIIKRLPIDQSDIFIVAANSVVFYFSLFFLYKSGDNNSIEIITLCFAIAYLAAGIILRKFLSLQTYLYNSVFCISLAAFAAFAAIKYVSFTLTIVWVVLAIIMFIIGMIYRLKMFRISSIILFAITLIKLLLIDSIGFNSVEKVVAYLFIGVVLLVISFLYQKFKKIIFGEIESDT